MPNYIRARVSGGTFFFTVTLADRSSNLLIERVDDLRASFALAQRDMPFQCDAMVVLPDHLHAVWTLPDGDDDFSTRWKRIEAGFYKSVGIKAPPSKSQASSGEVGIWQRRFWEHCIRDDKDYENHMRYCAWNPVKHGYVETPEAWQFSSVHRDAKKGNVWWT